MGDFAGTVFRPAGAVVVVETFLLALEVVFVVVVAELLRTDVVVFVLLGVNDVVEDLEELLLEVAGAFAVVVDVVIDVVALTLTLLEEGVLKSVVVVVVTEVKVEIVEELFLDEVDDLLVVVTIDGFFVEVMEDVKAIVSVS